MKDSNAVSNSRDASDVRADLADVRDTSDQTSDSGEDSVESAPDIPNSLDATDSGETTEPVDSTESGQTDAVASDVKSDGSNTASDAMGDDADIRTDTADANAEVETETSGPPPPLECDQTPRPPRCDKTPDEFDWGPASVVSTLEVASGTISIDGRIRDNNLGSILNNTGFRSDMNSEIKDNVQSGAYLILMEFGNLEDFNGTASNIRVNTWRASFDNISQIPLVPGDPNTFKIKPTSIDAGVHPKHLFAPADLTWDDNIVSTRGSIAVELPLFEHIPIQATLQNAKLELTVDLAKSELDGAGVFSYNGKLAGAVSAEDIYGNINDFASNCKCLKNLDNDLIDYSATNPSGATCEPSDSYDDTCGIMGANGACHRLAVFCQSMTQILNFDKDTDDNGSYESISLALTFETNGAEITGLDQ